MFKIPSKALEIGAETLNNFPVRYNKIRLSGTQSNPYYLHSKSCYMPGQVNKFKTISTTIPEAKHAINNNQIIREYKLNHERRAHSLIGQKYSEGHLDEFTYEKFSPSDDETLEIAIRASYKQVFGNFTPMSSERLIDSERRLRNGDISIKEFIRAIAKSPFYLAHYFEEMNQENSIKLRFKHLLGRPIISQSELTESIVILNEEGFHNHVDHLINSLEYHQVYGEDIVPYMRSWDSPLGSKTISFMETSYLTRSFASSDNALKMVTKKI